MPTILEALKKFSRKVYPEISLVQLIKDANDPSMKNKLIESRIGGGEDYHENIDKIVKCNKIFSDGGGL